jgi:uncharacterized membrane protein
VRFGALRDVRRPVLAVAGMAGAYAVTFAVLSVVRHRGFHTAKYDLGNMTQAVWSAAHGGLFRVTDPNGAIVSRLGSHVDPILGVFAPLWWIWPRPEMLLVVQALAVSTMAIPAYLLARRWLADERLALTFAAVALLLPAVQWATLFDFHPVTLAAPLLLWCIWAAVEHRNVTLGVLAVLAMMTKEQVGLALVFLGLWMVVTLGRRYAGTFLAAAGFIWTALAVSVVIPHFNAGGTSALLEDRYGTLGNSVGGVLKSIVTRPWEVVQIAVSADRAVYVLALLLPLLGLSLRAPLLAAGALPDLVLNLLSSKSLQHDIAFHYSAVIAPFLLAAAILGLKRLRDGGRPWVIGRFVGSPKRVATALVLSGVICGYAFGPLPFWQYVPGGSDNRVDEFAVGVHAGVLRRAVALIPSDAPVSAGNRIGGHLATRPVLVAFPVIADATYVVVDTSVPDVGDEREPDQHAAALAAFRARRDFTQVFGEDGVLVFRRSPA